MSWTPRWRHVTQIHTDGSGWNDCGEASLARAIMEYDPATPGRAGNQEWQLPRDIHDPSNPATIWDLISRLSVLARGTPDSPSNGFTSADGIQRMLAAFGLHMPANYADGPDAGWQATVDHPLALCWVDGVTLAPPSFPASYFGGDWGYDHLILSLPVEGLYNDPLTIWPDTRTDTRYTDAAVRAALGGAWILPAPEPVAPVQYHVIARCALKSRPNHLGAPGNPTRAELAAGAGVTLTGQRTPHWLEVRAGDAAGWVLGSNVAA